jgi:hypothetical protein
VSSGAGRVGEQRGESLHPAVDGDVINLETPFGQQFFDVTVRETRPDRPGAGLGSRKTGPVIVQPTWPVLELCECE